jgi:hypothetical protein
MKNTLRNEPMRSQADARNGQANGQAEGARGHGLRHAFGEDPLEATALRASRGSSPSLPGKSSAEFGSTPRLEVDTPTEEFRPSLPDCLPW